MTRSMKTIRALGLCLLLGLSGIACGGLDGEQGGNGQPCLPGGVCNAGLVCNAADICEPAAASGFSALYQSSSFQSCNGCHAPGAPGFQTGVEATQNWSSRATAHASLQGNASGLTGNFEGCNGVPLIGDTPANSLLVAVFDETIRAAFSSPNFPDCNADAISDMTLKIGGELSAQEMTLLKDWITAGTPDN